MHTEFIGRQANVLKANIKVGELAKHPTIHYASDMGYFLEDEPIVKYYGFETNSMSKIQFENVVKSLLTLSIQCSNIMRFHKNGLDDLSAFAFSPAQFNLPKRFNYKTLTYLKSRIEYYNKRYDLDENYFPREKCTYNEELINAFYTMRRAVFVPNLEALKNVPSRYIVKRLNEEKTVIGDAIVLTTNKQIKEFMMERYIMLLY